MSSMLMDDTRVVR